jgi:AraC-like DNA-binding protein
MAHTLTAWVAAAANLIIWEGGGRIPALADRAGLSLRQFERRFVEQVGLSPKLLARIARFEATLDLMARSPAPHGLMLLTILAITTTCTWSMSSLNSPAKPRRAPCTTSNRSFRNRSRKCDPRIALPRSGSIRAPMHG